MKYTFNALRPLTWLAAWFLVLGALHARAQTVNVGPARTYPTLSAAVSAGAVVSGSTVRIDDGTYTDKTIVAGVSNVTITSSSGRTGGVVFDGGSQDNLADRKAIIVARNSPGIAIVGIRFQNAGLGGQDGLDAQGRGAGNQAGIRFEQFPAGSTGRVSYCSFDNCVTGVFTESNDFNLDLTVDHCDFGYASPNGLAPDGGSHDAYINRIHSFTGIDNNWYGALYANNCKVRAFNINVSGGYNRNNNGRCIDMPNGGHYSITGGVYVRGTGEQSQLFDYAAEYPSPSDPSNNGLYDGTVSGITIRASNHTDVWNNAAGTTMTFTNTTQEWYGSGVYLTLSGPGAIVGLATNGSTTASSLPPPPPPVSSSTPTTNPGALRPADTPSGTVAGVQYQYYEATGLSALPDFSALTPVATGTVATFDISPRRRQDDFAFRYTGYVQVPQDGQYTFYTSSDDGSRLYIGNQLVVDNDGLHGTQERSGTIGLRAGLHAVTVGFFERGGNQVLNVSYQGPGLSKQTVPASALVSVPANPSSSGIVSGGVYRLVARHSGKALDVPGNSTANEVGLQQYTVNNTSAQAWVVTLGSDGYYTLTHQGTGQVLDLYTNNESNGTTVQQYAAHGGDAQKWRLVPTGDGYYKVLHKDSNKGLDVDAAGQQDGARVQLWEYVGGPNYNQQWGFERLDQASRPAAATVAASSTSLAESAPLSAYPNPVAAQQRPTLAFAAEQAQRVTVTVRNAQGGLVNLLTVPVQAGRTDFALPSALPAGTYFVQAVLDGQKQRFTLKVE